MGIRGTARRNQDGHIIHCNIDTDVIISEEIIGSTSIHIHHQEMQHYSPFEPPCVPVKTNKACKNQRNSTILLSTFLLVAEDWSCLARYSNRLRDALVAARFEWCFR